MSLEKSVLIEQLKRSQLSFRERLNELNKIEKQLEPSRLEQRTLLDVEMLEEMGFAQE